MIARLLPVRVRHNYVLNARVITDYRFTKVAEHDFLGSLSILLGKDLPGDRRLPDWLEEGTDSSLRDTEVCISPSHYLSFV